MYSASSQVTEFEVETRVGSTKVFTVHTEKLMLSPFFKRLMETSRTFGAEVRHLDLRYLETYISFLYTRTLATSTAGADNDPAALRDETALLGQLYRFGFQMIDPQFRNAILDAIIEISYLKDKKTGVPCLPDPMTFKGYALDSPAWRCIVDLYVRSLDPDDPAIDRPENQHFMREVFKASMRRADVNSDRGNFRRQKLRMCDYHEHEDGVRCCDGDEK